MPFDVKSIQKATRKVASFLEKNPKTPGQDAVHDLRTSSRSLETAFITLGLDQKTRVDRLVRHLAAIRKQAGKVRDMDVLTEDALTLKPAGEQTCHVQLLEYLGARRVRFARKLRRMVHQENGALQRNLKRNSRHLEKLLRQAQAPDSDTMAAAIARTIQLAEELKKPTRLTRSNLHPYRLKVKELRNVLQLSAETAGSELLVKLGDVKDAIGEWHDWEELIGIATELLDHGARCRLLKRLKATSDAKFERALSLTKELRRDYLNVGATDLSEPVIQATSAIARG
jgi:CHAD domain-containing protein